MLQYVWTVIAYKRQNTERRSNEIEKHSIVYLPTHSDTEFHPFYVWASGIPGVD